MINVTTNKGTNRHCMLPIGMQEKEAASVIFLLKIIEETLEKPKMRGCGNQNNGLPKDIHILIPESVGMLDDMAKEN